MVDYDGATLFLKPLGFIKKDAAASVYKNELKAKSSISAVTEGAKGFTGR